MNSRAKLWVAAAVLIAIHAVVLFAGFFAPYDPQTQDRELPYARPMRPHLRDAAAHWHLRPFVYPLHARETELDVYVEDRSHSQPLYFFVRGDEYTIAGMIKSNIHLFGVANEAAPASEANTRVYLLGTDAFGRDQLSRLLYGGRISLTAGLLATALALLIGTTLGVLAGFYGGLLDDALMRLSELFTVLPWLYLLLAVRAFLPLHIDAETSFLLLVAIIGCVGWARPARLVRGIALSGRERGYVIAARGFGASNLYLMRRHVLPQTVAVVLTQAALLVPQYILAEVTLSFLGLGVGEPAPSWGAMLANLQQYHVLVSYWWLWIPALVLVVLFIAFNAIAEGLQNRLQFDS
jgi:peptide/nickel transport system permease protein